MGNFQEFSAVRADRLAGQIIIATCGRHHASTAIICNYNAFTPESHTTTLFVTRKNWLEELAIPSLF
jgi:hypothetical protein